MLAFTARRQQPGPDGLWLKALGAVLVALALEVAASAEDSQGLPFAVWQVEEGLEQIPITAVLQTRDGYLWLGTYTGLVRFDGVRQTVFAPANTPKLRNSRITSLYEDPAGVLCIGHESGEVTFYQSGEFRPQGPVGKWPGGAVESMGTDEAGDLWLLSGSGALVRLRDGHVLGPLGDSSASRKVALARERNGKLWLAGNGKVASVARGELVPFGFDDPGGTNFYERVVPAQDGGLWVMTSTALRKWRQGQWLADLGVCPCEAGFVTELMETRAGRLVAGTVRDGVYVLTPGGEPMHFARTNGLSHDWVRSFCEDYEGNLWIGTSAGLDALRPRKVRMLNPPDAWQGRAVLSFAVAPAGEVWAGTEGAGVYHKYGEQWRSFTEANGLSNLFVWSVLETRAADLYIGTWGGGLQVRNGERFTTRGDLGRVTAPVVALYESQSHGLWVGTTIGLHCFEQDRLALTIGQDRLSSPDVRSITESADGTIWFGMLGGGLGSWKNGRLTQYRQRDGLGSDFVLALYADPDGSLWIGTSDNGLCRLRAGRFATISKPQGLLDSIVSQIADDGSGGFWLGSHRGILRVNKAELNRCANREIPTVRCLSYGKAEGMASAKCSGAFQPNFAQTADGRLWFPTAKGLAIIDPHSFGTNAVPPPVVIEGLRVEGLPVKLPAATDPTTAAGASAPVQIRAGQQHFELRYTGLSFTAPDKVRFKYKLEGLEKEWVDAGTRRVVEYAYLQPGTYTFRVTACNDEEVWNEEGATCSFVVLPHFWQTWWCKTLAVLAAGGGIAAAAMWVARRRVHQRLEHLERQRSLERERARIARDIHDDLGSSLTRISLLSQSALAGMDAQQPGAADVDQIYHTARELTRAMDEIVWAVNPRHDTLDSLVAYLGRFAQNYLSATSIRCRLDVPLQLPAYPLTSEIRHNTFLAFKEALHNVVKHAQASEVRISMELRPEGFMLVVADNGRGFRWNRENVPNPSGADGARAAAGNGLVNMQKRLEEIGGCCGWDTAPGEGTRVRLEVVMKR